MSSPPMKSPWRWVQKGQRADGKIWIKHIRKDFHFSGKNHSTPFNADEMTTGNRDCTVCSVSSASASLAQVTSCLTSFCFAALGALVPDLDPRVWTMSSHSYKLLPCQMKHHVKQKLAQDTDLLDKPTITHCRHLNYYHLPECLSKAATKIPWLETRTFMLL